MMQQFYPLYPMQQFQHQQLQYLPITPPTIACVVETGAPTAVATFNHTAAAKSAAVIAQTKFQDLLLMKDQ